MVVGELTMEKIVLIFLLIGAGLYILRHLKNIMVDGEKESKCHNCLWQINKGFKKDKSAT